MALSSPGTSGRSRASWALTLGVLTLRNGTGKLQHREGSTGSLRLHLWLLGALVRRSRGVVPALMEKKKFVRPRIVRCTGRLATVIQIVTTLPVPVTGDEESAVPPKDRRANRQGPTLRQ